MRREFSIVRVKKQVTEWEFPLCWDEVPGNPLGAPFSAKEQSWLDVAVGCFPFARRTKDGRRAWRISSSAGTIEVWVTSDGSLFIEGDTTLNLVFGLYVHLKETIGELVVEDRITDVVHNEQSLLRLVRREEAALVPWETAA
ncbi:MAG: hypothetical protein ACOZQL_24655 [Myxococcota bacterium]